MSGNALARRDQSTDVQKQQDARQSIATLLNKPAARAQIEAVLPPGVTFDQFRGLAALAAYNNPDVFIDCTPASIVFGLTQIAQWDLVPGQTAYLVPFKGKAVPVASYKGLIELVVRSGAARAIDAHVVYEGEHFRVQHGSTDIIEHTPARSAKERGKIAGAYAIARISAGIHVSLWMPVEDIEAIRQHYSKQHKGGALEPWYALKCVVRHLCDKLPKRSSLSRIIANVDAAEDGSLDAPALQTAPEPLRMNPAYPGRALADAGESPYDADRAPTAPRRVIRDEDLRRDPAALKQWTQGPDEYELGGNGSEDELPPVDEAFDDVAQAGPGSTPNSRTPAAAPASTSATADVPPCPDCGGSMYDNRRSKRSSRTPDFKCRDQDCNKAIWLDKGRR